VNELLNDNNPAIVYKHIEYVCSKNKIQYIRMQALLPLSFIPYSYFRKN